MSSSAGPEQHCGRPMVPIVYGMPGTDLVEAAERGEVAIGGCLIWLDNPAYECLECGATTGSVAESDL